MAEEEEKTESMRALEKWCNQHSHAVELKYIDEEASSFNPFYVSRATISPIGGGDAIVHTWSAPYNRTKSIIHQRDEAAKKALQKIREIEEELYKYKRILALTKLLEPPKKKKKSEDE